MDLPPSALIFHYRSFDGQTSARCVHSVENPLSQDWKVLCPLSETTLREYSVHLWVTKYPRTSVPKARFEVLYWVTDRATLRVPQSSGTTFWFHSTEETDLHALEISQSIENDTAGLYLEITPVL